jgi:hypothetical protein
MLTDISRGLGLALFATAWMAQLKSIQISPTIFGTPFLDLFGGENGYKFNSSFGVSFSLGRVLRDRRRVVGLAVAQGGTKFFLGHYRSLCAHPVRDRTDASALSLWESLRRLWRIFYCPFSIVGMDVGWRCPGFF